MDAYLLCVSFGWLLVTIFLGVLDLDLSFLKVAQKSTSAASLWIASLQGPQKLSRHHITMLHILPQTSYCGELMLHQCTIEHPASYNKQDRQPIMLPMNASLLSRFKQVHSRAAHLTVHAVRVQHGCALLSKAHVCKLRLKSSLQGLFELGTEVTSVGRLAGQAWIARRTHNWRASWICQAYSQSCLSSDSLRPPATAIVIAATVTAALSSSMSCSPQSPDQTSITKRFDAVHFIPSQILKSDSMSCLLKSPEQTITQGFDAMHFISKQILDSHFMLISISISIAE